MNLQSLRPFALFAGGFLACFVLVSSGGAREKDTVQDLRAAVSKAAQASLEDAQRRIETGSGTQEDLALWGRRYNDARVAAGEITAVQGARANLELAKRAESDTLKLAKFGQRSKGDVTQARYFRLRAELELELAKRGAKKK